MSKNKIKKSGKKSKASVKPKKAKSPAVKVKTPKTPKEGKVESLKALKEEKVEALKTLKEKKVEAEKPLIMEIKTSFEEPIVVEIPKEEKGATPAAATPQVTFTPAAVVEQPTKPDGMDLMIKSLDKMLASHGKPLTKSGVEAIIKLNPRNLPFYVTPKYDTKTFTIEVSDGTKKVSTRPHPLAV